MPPKKNTTLPTDTGDNASEIAVALAPAAQPVPIPNQVIEAEPINAARAKGEVDPFLVRVTSPSGKLLFMYNARADSIEIKELHGGLYSIPLKEMRAIAMSRVFSPHPQGDIVLDESGSYTTTNNHAADEKPDDQDEDHKEEAGSDDQGHKKEAEEE